MSHDLPTWRLSFDDRPGLVVEVSVPTVEARTLATRLVPAFTSNREAAILDAVAQLAAPFADSLVSWTARTPGGRPAPATRKGTARVDVWLLLDVLTEWMKLWPALEPAAPAEAAPDPDLMLLASLPMIPVGDEAEQDLAHKESSVAEVSIEDDVHGELAELEAVG